MVPLVTPLISCDASASRITWPVKSCNTSFRLSWPKKCNGVIDDTTDLTADTSTTDVTWSKGHTAVHFDCLDIRNVIAQLASCDSSTNGVMWPKKYVEPHFNCLDLMNRMCHYWSHWQYLTWVSMPVVSHDKKVMCTSFQLSWPTECNGAIIDAFIVTWYWCQCQWHHMTKKSCCTSFLSSQPKEWNSAIYDASTGASDITWPKSHNKPMNFLNNRTIFDLRQAFGSSQYGFLRSKENVDLNSFVNT